MDAPNSAMQLGIAILLMINAGVFALASILFKQFVTSQRGKLDKELYESEHGTVKENHEELCRKNDQDHAFLTKALFGHKHTPTGEAHYHE